MKRKQLTKSQSNKNYSKGAASVDSKNRLNPTRGSIRI